MLKSAVQKLLNKEQHNVLLLNIKYFTTMSFSIDVAPVVYVGSVRSDPFRWRHQRTVRFVVTDDVLPFGQRAVTVYLADVQLVVVPVEVPVHFEDSLVVIRDVLDRVDVADYYFGLDLLLGSHDHVVLLDFVDAGELFLSVHRHVRIVGETGLFSVGEVPVR